MEYKKLDDILDYIQPTDYIVESENYSIDYDVPVLTAGQTFLLGYTNEKNGIYYAKDLFLLSLDLFLLPYSEFVNKFEKLKQKLGNNYINKLSEDISLIEIMYD